MKLKPETNPAREDYINASIIVRTPAESPLLKMLLMCDTESKEINRNAKEEKVKKISTLVVNLIALSETITLFLHR